MRTQIALMTTLGALCALPGAALAQDVAAPVAPAGETTPVAAPATPPAPAGESAGVVANPEPASTPATESAAAGPTPMPGWIRIDSDLGGLQLWGGGTYPIADGIGLAFDLYALQAGGGASLGELDLGPAITAGPVTITPMIGLQVDWTAHKAASLVPQLYVTGGTGPIYGELWLQYYMNKTFDGASNQLYGRLFADFKANDFIAFGPELDLIHDSEADLASLAVGPNVMLSNVGPGGSFIAFLGYETKDTFGDNHVAGRLTYVKNF